VTDKQLVRIAKGMRSGVLDGRRSRMMCAVVCAPLQGYLGALGFDTELIDGEVPTDEVLFQHVWLETKDGRIIDPTADQFPHTGLPPVYVGPLPDCYTRIGPLRFTTSP